MNQPWLLVALGGAIGATLRYGVWRLTVALFGGTWPVGTAIVNVVGSLLLGLIVGLGPKGLPPEVRAFAATGILGAFTTFSTFSVESASLAQRGDVTAAIGNVVVNTVLGISDAVIGLWLARAVPQV